MKSGVSERAAKGGTIFQINHRQHIRPLLGSVNEGDEIRRAGLGVEIADEQNPLPPKPTCSGDFPQAVDGAVRLPDGVAALQDEVVGPEHHALAVSAPEEIRAIVIECWPLAAAGDQAQCAIFPQCADIGGGKRVAGVPSFLRVIRGNIHDFRRILQTHPPLAAATDGQKCHVHEKPRVENLMCQTNPDAEARQERERGRIARRSYHCRVVISRLYPPTK